MLTRGFSFPKEDRIFKDSLWTATSDHNVCS